VNTNYKPLAFASAIFLVLAVVFLVSAAFLHAAHLSASIGAALAFLPYLAALASGALLGYAARVRVLPQLILLGCFVALGFGLLNLAHDLLIGPVDFPGPSGSGLVVLMSLPFAVILCVAGGCAGVLLHRVKRN
jgi:hypothetical protein